MLQLYFKRAKLFLTEQNGKEERFTAPVGGPVSAPDWVKGTDGYKYGVKDGSIVDITPPKSVTEVEEAPEPEVEETEPEVEETAAAASPRAARASRAGAGTIR